MCRRYALATVTGPKGRFAFGPESRRALRLRRIAASSTSMRPSSVHGWVWRLMAAWALGSAVLLVPCQPVIVVPSED